MDSGDSDRDRKLSGTQGSTDNPFIRFRRFADSQISAVLRGIIGLPSAISEGFDANRSWKTESNGLNGGENSRANQRAGFEEDGDCTPPAHNADAVNSSTESPAGAGASAKRKIRDDIDLYSPVIKSLSSHLHRTVGDSIDWSKRGTGAEFMCNIHKSFLKPVDETPPNVLSMIQLMMYNPLNTATHGSGCRLFHSDKSLLPYILLSPYTPLGISSLPSPRQARALCMSPKDSFPYRRAFTDLLLASQGREMCQWKTQDVMDVSEELTSYEGSWTDGGVEHPLFDEWDCRISRAYDGVDWIESLSDLGLLSIDQSHWRKVDLRPSWQTTSTPKMTTPTEMSRNSSTPAPSMSMENAQTEQDMYNRFLEVTSSSPNPKFSDLGSLISEMQRLALEQSKHFSQEDHSSAPQDPTRFLSETLNDLESTLVRVALENRKGKDSRGKQAVPSEQLSKNNIDQSEVKSCLDEEQLKPDVEQEAGRIVSTTKTTERIRLEDGSVRTLVKTEKVFGDGRSVTETAYDQTPSAWAEDNSKSWLAGNDQHDAPCQDMWLDAKSRAQEKKSEIKKDDSAGRKGGWFWN